MNIDLVLKRLELIKEGKGIGTISDIEASIILNEIERLKERIEYLERSNNRREDEILELRQENADLDNIINELEKYLIERIECNQGSELQDYLENTCSMIYSELQDLKGKNKGE